MLPRINPKFSIITVTFNAEKYIEETIMSVITQTYHNIEYIIVDGKSTDKTMSIVEKYKDRISKIISEPDKGLYDAMNKGIDLATGDYLCFLNAGDTLHEDDTIYNMVHSINNHHSTLPDILYGETEIVDEEGHFISMRRHKAPEQLNWKSFKQGMMVCHQAFFANRRIMEYYNLKYSFSADFDWCIRLMKKADKIHNTHLTIIEYRNEGMTTRNHKASLKERYHIMCNHYGTLSTILHHIWFVFRLIIKPEKKKAANR